MAWVGLFGPTNPDVTGPYDPSRGEALVAPFRKPASCDSCWKQAFKYEDDRCRTLPAGSCMDHLTVGRVLGATLRRLADVHPLPAAARAAARRAALAGRAVPIGPALGY